MSVNLNNNIDRLKRVSVGATCRVGQRYEYVFDVLRLETNRTSGFQISMFHRAFFNSIIDKTPTHALYIQHYISLAC